METKRLGVVILAAGAGTRMRSALPKVLHPVCGRPLVEHVIGTAQQIGADEVVLVLGPDTIDRVREQYGDAYAYAVQEQRLGTGHAVLQARSLLEGAVERVLILYGADPLMTVASIRTLLAELDRPGVKGAITTFKPDDLKGFGRIVRGSNGQVEAIVEEREAMPDQLLIAEVNQGVAAYDAAWLWSHLDRLQPSRANGELYLTDLVAMAIEEHGPGAIAAYCLADPDEALGVNNRWELARVERVMRQRILYDLMLAGVTIMDPAHTYVDAEVCIGEDTVLLPGTILKGTTTIGRGCEIGPNSVIEDSAIGDGCRVTASFLERAVMEDGSNVGPMSHLRPGAHLGPGAHVGNFGEMKSSTLGAGAKMGHVSYLGDTQVGPKANIGAGTITANYDGRRKHATTIGAGAFIGSDTILRAPVEIGEQAVTGAGSVVTRDVPAGALAVGVPARIRRARSETGATNEESATT